MYEKFLRNLDNFRKLQEGFKQVERKREKERRSKPWTNTYEK